MVRLFAYRLLLNRSGTPSGTRWWRRSRSAPRPPEPVGVGSLFELHEQAGIQLRVVPHLWPFWDAVVAGTLGLSGIRLKNAASRPQGGPITALRSSGP